MCSGKEKVKQARREQLKRQRYAHTKRLALGAKNVVFIGDSRVRYQFMNLAAYLKYERFMKCADVTINPADADEECFVINERLKQNN